jgi:hypothetical protein
MADEVAFISGVSANGTLPLYAFGAWNPGTIPADYSGGYTDTEKWGAGTAGTAGGTVYYYFNPASGWSATEQQWLSAGLALWSAVANISFVQTSSSSQAQITFTRGSKGSAQTSTNTTGGPGAGLTGGSVLYSLTGATVSIDTSVPGFGPIDGSFSNYGGYPLSTLIHEEGHAIGLGHAGPYNTTSSGSQQYSIYDTTQWTLMSYFSPTDSTGQYYSQNPLNNTVWGRTGGYENGPTTLMPLDILAAQALYGAPTSTPFSGGQVFGFNTNLTGQVRPFFDFTQNTKPIVTIWDAGTNNTLDLSGFNSPSTVNLNPGTFSSCDNLTNNIAIAFGTAIDTLVLGPNTGVLGADIDYVTCNNDGDTIYCSTPTAVITGGTGNDTAYWTSPINVVNGLTMDGGGGWNRVVFSTPSSDYSWSWQNGTVNVRNSSTAVASGLTRVDVLQFTDQTVAVRQIASRDFNAAGQSDILWENSGGQYAIWEMNGTTVAGGGFTSVQLDSNWTLLSTADFDGSGSADILWKNNATDQLAIWEMNGTTVAGGGFTSLQTGPDWQVIGTGDFNGDGKGDILWKNSTTGQMAVWQMNGTTVAGGGFTSIQAGSDWNVIGTGDFNGDGNTDLLWKNTNTGQLAMWYMNGTTVTGGGFTNVQTGPDWTVLGTGDFNGDGKSDILWKNTSTGQLAVWLMNGTTVAGGGFTSIQAGSDWQVKSIGDYNGDGNADILWTNINTGAPAVWFMSGTNVLPGGGFAGSNPGAGWNIITGTVG